MELLKADSCIWQWQAERLTHKQTLILLLFWTWLSLSLSLSSEWQHLLLNECLKSENKNKHEVFPLVFSLDCEQGGVLVQSLSVRLTRDVTMFNVWQERSQIINMWSVPLVTSSHWLYNFVCLFDSFAVIIFYFIRTPCEPTESFRCFFPIPVFTEALKGFFFFFAFFYQWKKVWMCFIVILLIICFHVWIQVTFHLFPFRRSFSLWFFQPVSHIKKMSLFVSLCTWLPFFSSLKKKVFTHNGKKQKKNEKDSSSKTLFSFLVGRGFYSFLTFKKHFPY